MQKSKTNFYFLIMFISKDVVGGTMRQELVHWRLTEHVWFAPEEATVTLTLLTVAFSVHQDWLQLRKEAPMSQIAKVSNSFQYFKIDNKVSDFSPATFNSILRTRIQIWNKKIYK